MFLQIAKDMLVNLDKVYQIYILPPYWNVIATHHSGDPEEFVLYDGFTEADCRAYYDWLMNAIERVHPDQRIIRNTFDAPSTKEEALARAQAKDSES